MVLTGLISATGCPAINPVQLRCGVLGHLRVPAYRPAMKAIREVPAYVHMADVAEHRLPPALVVDMMHLRWKCITGTGRGPE